MFTCAADNDLYRVVSTAGPAAARFDSAAEAVAAAADSTGVLLLADGYPAKRTPVDPAVLAEAARKKLRVYVEYPEALPDLKLAAPRRAAWERTVVTSDAFGPALEKMRILMVQDCHFLPVEAANPHLVLAKVAGYDKGRLRPAAGGRLAAAFHASAGRRARGHDETLAVRHGPLRTHRRLATGLEDGARLAREWCPGARATLDANRATELEQDPAAAGRCRAGGDQSRRGLVRKGPALHSRGLAGSHAGGGKVP